MDNSLVKASERYDKGTRPRSTRFLSNVTSKSHFMLFSRVVVGTVQTRGQSMTTSELPLGPASLQLADSNDGEKSSGNLGDLLDQVSKNSVGEVDGLIGELRQLRAKLQADGDRIKRDIAQYETLSQQVVQLTKIISDSVATLSNARRLVDGRTH